LLRRGLLATGDRHRRDEVFLKARFNGRLDFYDIADLLLDKRTRFPIEQCDAGTCARGIASRRNLFEIALGDQPESHGVLHIDVRAKGTSESNAINLVRTEVFHKELGAGVQCGLRQLDGADVVLRYTNLRVAIV
jgi:hypothetical protein